MRNASKEAWLIELRRNIQTHLLTLPPDLDAVEKVGFKAALDQLVEMCYTSEKAPTRKRPLDIEYYSLPRDTHGDNDANQSKKTFLQ